ncbi:FAD-dependent thymidylate synthase [Candidatus Woesearchaeota archaeon]|nr:FAD-dependent thymidylate synthase [Candidatus Woesearchaeota archaeon]
MVKSTVDDSFSKMPEVKLIASYANPDRVAAAGAYGCKDQKSADQLFNSLKYDNNESERKREEIVFKNSIGKGHGSVGDQAYFTFSIENLPRATTLQLCLPEYLSHLQQSMRFTNANRGYYMSDKLDWRSASRTKNIMDNAFRFYGKLIEEKVPIEDSRFILPLAARTNIETTGPPREFQHLHAMNNQGEVPSVTKRTVDTMIEQGSEVAPGLFKNREKNYETLAWRPSSQLFASSNEVINKIIKDNSYDAGLKDEYCGHGPGTTVMIGHSDILDNSSNPLIDLESLERAVRERNESDLANLKHLHYEFLVPMSIAAFHQSTRQRTWNHSIESIYDAAKRWEVIVPPSIEKSGFAPEYTRINRDMLENYRKLTEDEGVPRSEAILYVPHGLQVHDWVHVDGWNAIHSIGKRRCITAQWEIRESANKMAEEIKKVNKPLGTFTEPQGFVYGKCPEKSKGKKKKTKADNCRICENKLEEYAKRSSQ